MLGQVYGGHWTGPPMIMTRSRLARRILPLIRTAVPQSHQELYDRISGQVRTAVKGGVVDKPCNGHDITSRTARHHSGNFGLCKRLQVLLIFVLFASSSICMMHFNSLDWYIFLKIIAQKAVILVIDWYL